MKESTSEQTITGENERESMGGAISNPSSLALNEDIGQQEIQQTRTIKERKKKVKAKNTRRTR